MATDSGARRHYRDLLGGVYEWSTARATDPFGRARAWLERRGLLKSGQVLDLGCGYGAHALPLLEAGARVDAVDFCPELIARLEAHAGATDALRTTTGDVLEFLLASERLWDRIYCLGDTVTHLDAPERVRELLGQAAGHLRPGGRLAVQWRDLTGWSASDTERFIPVAQDGDRTMHCLIEAIDASRVRVTDLVTARGTDGLETRIGSYRKLRLDPIWMHDAAAAAGLVVVASEDRDEQGMCACVYRR